MENAAGAFISTVHHQFKRYNYCSMSKNSQQALTFFMPRPPENNLGTIYFDTGISAGFPSPADDFKQERLSLDSELIKNKEATFLHA